GLPFGLSRTKPMSSAFVAELRWIIADPPIKNNKLAKDEKPVIISNRVNRVYAGPRDARDRARGQDGRRDAVEFLGGARASPVYGAVQPGRETWRCPP